MKQNVDLYQTAITTFVQVYTNVIIKAIYERWERNLQMSFYLQTLKRTTKPHARCMFTIHSLNVSHETLNSLYKMLHVLPITLIKQLTRNAERVSTKHFWYETICSLFIHFGHAFILIHFCFTSLLSDFFSASDSKNLI